MENNFSFSNKNTLQIVNYSLIKESLENGEELTSRQIAQMVQLSLPAVNATIEQMLKTGEIIEKRTGLLSVFNNEKSYILNENYSFKLTVQLNFKSAVFTVYNYCDKQVFNQPKTFPSNQPINDFLIVSISELSEKYKITSCSMAFPCAVNNGFVYSSLQNFRQFENVDLQALFQKKFNIPFVLQNSSNAAASGFYKKNENFLFEKSPVIFVSFEENYPKICTFAAGKILNGFSNCAGNLSILKKFQFSASFSNSQKTEYFSELIEYIAAFINPQIVYFFKNDFIQNISEDSASEDSCLPAFNDDSFMKNLPIFARPQIELIDDFSKYCDLGLLNICKNVSRETFLSQVEQI